MDTRLRARIEIETLHELLPELDAYKLLGLAEGCAQADVDAAFRNESRRLHPDRVAAGGTPELRTKANDVFKALTEAGRNLRDPDARAAYDAQRKGGSRAEEEARRAAEAAKYPARAARTPKGEKHWKMALQNWNDEDYNGAAMNIQFALQFEPQNEVFKEWLAKAKEAWNEKKRGKGSTYKIRLG
jgi:DnaJ-class molecular chaperone